MIDFAALNTRESLEPQEILDAAAQHLLSMPRKSYDPYDDSCLYRTPGGNRCVAGAFIRDDEYNSGMEGLGVTVLKWNGTLPKRLIPHTDLLSQLQSVHDCAVSWEDDGPADRSSVSECLHDVAFSFGLAVPAIVKVEG